MIRYTCVCVRMPTLDELSIDFVRASIGCRVRSMMTGNEGTIASVSDRPDREDYNITVIWDGGHPEGFTAWHFWCHNVELIDWC